MYAFCIRYSLSWRVEGIIKWVDNWRHALEKYGFRLTRSKIEYMTGNFSKRRSVFSVKVKVGVHIIPAFTQFKYLGYIVQNVGEIEGDVKHQIQAGWLK